MNHLVIILLRATLIGSILAFSFVEAQMIPGCQSSCGDLSEIPFPFGIRDGKASCHYAEPTNSFVIDCSQTDGLGRSLPYWSDPSTNIVIKDISLENHEMTIMVYVARDCYDGSSNSPRLTLRLFPISNTKNKFTAVGCDTFAVFYGLQNSDYATGCLSYCNSMDDVTNGSCSGIGCCQTAIPRNVMQYNISLRSLSSNRASVSGFNPCSFAFVTKNDYFNFSTQALRNITEEMVPLVLDWAVGDQKCEEARMDMTSYMCRENSNCTDADNGTGYKCRCKDGYQGNPYISNGCQDIDECATENPCNTTCTNLPGTVNCSCPLGYEGDGFKNGSGCSRIISGKKYTTRDIGLGVSSSILAVLLCGSCLFLVLEHKKAVKQKEKFFRENGGLMLQRLLSEHGSSSMETLKVFNDDELRKATDNYDETRILGQGGQGTVYKGIVTNNKVVAIKKARMVDQSQVQDFINEVIVLSQINHKNVVKLIGCCLETEYPLLVYEFVANGTLSDHIQSDCHGSAISSWDARLRIAAETAGALSYLHSDTSMHIVHRDVKSSNILLDEHYTAKVSDFGASRLMPADHTQLSTLVQGTLGYLDPEYFQSGQLTEKSDVYSFGIVLAELLTGMKAISFDKKEKDRYLSMNFLLAIKEDRVLEIVDKRILEDANVEAIREVAMLTSRCLKMRGEDRPTMREVAHELEGLVRIAERHPWTNEGVDLKETEYLLKEMEGGSRRSTASIGTSAYDSTMNMQAHFNIEDGR